MIIPRLSKLPHRNGKSSEKQVIFLTYYVEDFNVKNAALKSGITLRVAYTWLKKPEIQSEIDRLCAERKERLKTPSDDVAQYWWNLATADARELAPIRVHCCRFCWGMDYGYQFTLNELREAQRRHHEAQMRKNSKDRVDFDDLGGGDYDIRREPNPNCPECRGNGVSDLAPIDISKLSTGAALLFDGVKVYKDGSVEVKLRDRSRAMENFQLLVGLVKQRKEIPTFNPEDLSDEQLDTVLQAVIERGLLPALTDNSNTIEGESQQVEETVDSEP